MCLCSKRISFHCLVFHNCLYTEKKTFGVGLTLKLLVNHEHSQSKALYLMRKFQSRKPEIVFSCKTAIICIYYHNVQKRLTLLSCISIMLTTIIHSKMKIRSPFIQLFQTWMLFFLPWGKYIYIFSRTFMLLFSI